MSMVNAGSAYVRGLRPYFADTYKSMGKKINPMLELIADLTPVSDAYKETYAYFESAPHPRIWPRGKGIPEDAMRAVSFTVVNYDWAISIPFHENDESDDQTRSLQNMLMDAGENFAILDERVFFQMITGSTDTALLPSVPNAPDGAALFATTAGGSNRFGVSSGNSLTQTGGGGAGVSQTATVIKDYYRCISQFMLMQDTKGQPLWPDPIIRQGVVIIHGAANEQVFQQAFEQKNVVNIIQNVAGSENVAAAAATNIVLDSARKVTRWSTPRITDNSWYVCLLGTRKKPLFKQTRQPLRDFFRDMTNSDVARDTKVKRWQWDARYGYGIALPYQFIKIS